MDWELLAEQVDWRRKYERENGAPDPLEVETELLRMEREAEEKRPLTKFEWHYAKALLAWGRRL